MPNPTLIKNYIGKTQMRENTFVKISLDENQVELSNIQGGAVFGATTFVPLKTAMARVDIIHAGIAAMRAGAAVNRGAEVSSDAQGRAITKPTTGTPSVAGIALEKATAAEDIIDVLLK